MDELKEGNQEAESRERRHENGVFTFVDWVDVVLMLLGTIGAIGDGCSINCLLLFASNVMNSLGYGKAQDNHPDFMHNVEKVICSLNSSI